MPEYFILKDQQQVGPLTREAAEHMLQNGTFATSDLAWRTGLDSWLPLAEVLGAAGPMSIRQQEAAATPHQEVSWMPALVFYSILVGSMLIGLMGYLAGYAGIGDMLAMMGFPFLVASIVFWAILHYQCWQVLQPAYTAMTPGKAIGFLFVPFFNLYWAFVSWPELAAGFNVRQRARWGSIYFDTRRMAMVNAVLFSLSQVSIILFFFLNPDGLGSVFIEVFLAAGGLIAFVLFYRPIVRLANTL